MTPKQKDIEILTWNVNGIRAAERKGFLEWLDKRSPDVLCVQETKAEPGQLSGDLKAPEGYSVSWASAEKKGYSGVATFSKVEPKSVNVGLGIEEYDSEGRVLVTEFESFVLFNIYFPNGRKNDERLSYKLDFYDAVLDTAEKLRKRRKSLIICGDYNTAHKPVDLEHPDNNQGVSGFLPVERAWLDKLVARGYIDSLREFHSEGNLYTWWDLKTRARERNVGWRLDYHFVSDDLRANLKDAYILPDIYGSDHCPAGIKMNF